MNKLLPLLVVVAIVVGVWYVLMSGTNPLSPVAIPSAGPTEFSITLSEQDNSKEYGTATFVENNGQVIVTLSMTGAPKEVEQPAHIHVGQCPNVGAVKYALNSPVNGMSETVLPVTLDQLRSEYPLGLNVHKSNAEAKVYVSCGDLVF